MADDLAPLLRTLSIMFDVTALAWSPAFESALPQACWDDITLGSWAAPPPLQAAAEAKAGAVAQQAAGAPAGGQGSGEGEDEGTGLGSGSVDAELDLAGDESPQAAASPRQVAAARWQAAFVDCFGATGGLEVLLQVKSAGAYFGEICVR